MKGRSSLYFVNSHLMEQISRSYFMHYEKVIIFNLASANFLDHRRSNDNHEKMTNDDIYSGMNVLHDMLLLSDNIYSMCHQHCGTVTDAGLDDVGETIDIFSKLWRESNLSVTVKAHIIEVHLLDSIHRFRGLGKHDEEFMERDHQNGC